MHLVNIVVDVKAPDIVIFIFFLFCFFWSTMLASDPVCLNCVLSGQFRASGTCVRWGGGRFMNECVCVCETGFQTEERLHTCLGEGRFNLKLPLYRNRFIIWFSVSLFCLFFDFGKKRIKVLLHFCLTRLSHSSPYGQSY